MEARLVAKKRNETGKGAARRDRGSGNVPGVLYGRGIEPQAIQVKMEDLSEILKGERGSSAIINLEVREGKAKESHLAIIREIQREPLKDLILHVDFQKVTRDERVTVKAPLMLRGEEESVGLSTGGTLQHNIWEVDVSCLPGNVPDHVIADISKTAVGEHLTVSDLIVPPGVEILNNSDEIVLSIVPPRVLEEEAVEEVSEVPGEQAEVESRIKPGEETE